MKRRARTTEEALQNPTLIGSAILLVGLIALVLSYNANRGLPFVPTYDVKVDVPDAAELVAGADVRIGGARSGQVKSIRAVPGPHGGRPHAQLQLALDQSVPKLPVDTTVRIRPQSILGAKYLELIPGHSHHRLSAGATLPERQSRPVVEISDALQTFDAPTTRVLRRTIDDLGDALAGRGGAINDTVGSVSHLLGPLQRVSSLLADPRTDLAGFIDGAAATTSALAPVAPQLGSLIAGGATTLRAIEASDGSLGATIEALAPTEVLGTRVLRRITPVLTDAAVLARAIRPGTHILASTSRTLDVALRAATPVMLRIPSLTRRLAVTLDALQRLTTDKGFVTALRKLIPVTVSLGSALGVVSPAQTNCNILGLWTRNLASAFSDGDAAGSWLNSLLIIDLPQMLQSSTPAADLHVNYYPNETASDCEAGHEGYAPGQLIGNPAGVQAPTSESTSPPPGVRERAAKAGLLAPIAGAKP